MTSTEQSTLEHKVETTTNMHDAISAGIKGPEIRVYETKTLRKLASGEIREYTLKQHYVVKKKPGPSATVLKTQAANLRAKIAKTIITFSNRDLAKISEYCEGTLFVDVANGVNGCYRD